MKQSVVSRDPHDPEHEADFKKAYLKLVKKVYDEQGGNILITQDELDKAAAKEGFRQEEFAARIQ